MNTIPTPWAPEELTLACKRCGLAASWEPFRCCYVHDVDDGTLNHDVKTIDGLAVSFELSPQWPALEIVARRTTAGMYDAPIPRVTAEVAEQIAAWLEANGDDESSNPTAPEIRALPRNADGTVTIALGLMFHDAF